MEKIIYDTYINILHEELRPAMGCTEPIALAYCGAKAKKLLGQAVKKIAVYVSGNIIKNVKSVIVPNTDGMRGIETAVVAGIIAGDESLGLEVISRVNENQIQEIKTALNTLPITIEAIDDSDVLDIIIEVFGLENKARVRITGAHTNIVEMSLNDEVVYASSLEKQKDEFQLDRSLLNVKNIFEFTNIVDIDDVNTLINQQIDYNTAISKEGLKNEYGANIGKILLKTNQDIATKAKAWAAAGSDARMSGCDLPVVINSGSGNQGMTASLPVIAYANELIVSQEKLIRALVLSNLITIHQKTGIGKLSAYCGAVSAGIGAACGIAYLYDENVETIAHTIINGLAIVSGMVCDGAKPSCAAKIVSSVDAGLMGYQMYKHGQMFKEGDGLVSTCVEETIKNIGRLSSLGMKETDKEILRIMIEC